LFSNKIKFYSEFKNYIAEPKPSILNIPKEYKNMKSFVEQDEPRTVKTCVPFLDALTCGYIIPFPIDYSYRYDQENTKVVFKTNVGLPLNFADKFKVTNHPEYQVSKELRHNKRTVEAIFKFYNPWLIKTPPGYSCIFTQPFNRNLPFKIIDGIVDTDTYKDNIHFPFYWTNPHDEKIILEAGSPMVLVIPFKRESWKIETYVEKDKDLKIKSLEHIKFHSLIMNNYKKMVWNKKSFK